LCTRKGGFKRIVHLPSLTRAGSFLRQSFGLCMQKNAHVYLKARARTHIYTYTHIYLQARARTHIYTYTHVYLQARARTHIYTYTHVYIQARARTHIRRGKL